MDSDGLSFSTFKDVFSGLHVGYQWMFINCITSAAYVSCQVNHRLSSNDHLKLNYYYFLAFKVLAMRKRIKTTGFSDWDTMFYNNLLSIPVLAVFSLVFEDWGSENLSNNL
jgi:GDP-mannose transporter